MRLTNLILATPGESPMGDGEGILGQPGPAPVQNEPTRIILVTMRPSFSPRSHGKQRGLFGSEGDHEFVDNRDVSAAVG